MTTPAYLYGGQRRHIADPDEEPDWPGTAFWARAYCGGWHETETEAGLWPEELDHKKNMPVCQTCRCAYDRQTAT